MEAMTREEMVAWAATLPWYQSHDLPGDVKIKGCFDTEKQKWLLPDDLTGKRFLDLGCNSGFFVFEAEKRGAEAYGLDKQKNQLEKANVLRKYLGSHAHFSDGDIAKLYGWPHYALGFHVVLLTSVFHHLRKPRQALKMVRGLVLEHLTIEMCCFIPGLTRSWTRADVIPEDWGAAYHKAFPTASCAERTLLEYFRRVDCLGPNKNQQRLVFRAWVA